MSHTVRSPHQRRRRNARRVLEHLHDQARIHGAIPTMSRRAATQALWLHALDGVDEYALLRADSTRNARAIAWALARYTDWETMVARPGWDLLIELTCLARSTVAKYLALFAEWGLLGRVSSGSTWRTRGGLESDEDGNLAGEYVLCIPGQEPVEETRTPSLLRQEERSSACESSSRTQARESEPSTWPIHQTPETRGQQRDATQRLRQQVPLLTQLRSKRLIDLLTPWFELGWSPAQIRYALDHQPSDQPHWHTRDVRHVAGWLKHRLGLWQDIVPPALLGAGQATDLTAADVAQLPRATAAPVADTETHAARARRMLAATQRRSDKKPARGLGVSLPGRDGQAPATVSEATINSQLTVRKDADDWLLRNAAARARTTSDMPGRVVA